MHKKSNNYKVLVTILLDHAYLTQLVEYRFCKPNDIGSSPVIGFSATQEFSVTSKIKIL